MTRLRFNFLNGTLLDAVGAEDTIFRSQVFTELPEINEPDYVALVIDPAKQHGRPEIVHIVNHAESSSQAVVERGKEDTEARAHNQYVSWIHGLLVKDFDYIAGPPGPPGPNFTYHHHQEVPSSFWSIQHNLDGYPNVSVVDSAGSTVEGAVRYESKNLITIQFANAFAGSAYLS